MPESIGQEFMRKTRYPYLAPSPESQGATQPPLELPYPAAAHLIDLPEPAEIVVPSVDLRALIEQRRSVRKYSEQPLTLAELSYLLWCTQGVKSVTQRPVTLRTVPSAGARHAIETYLLLNHIEGLAPGLYRYIALQHALIEVSLAPDINDRLTHGAYDQHQVHESAATFIWVAITPRMTWRYVERGFRYLHLDAGHICQNLYLASESINCGVCAIAAYLDDEINTVLELDGEERFVIYLASVGKKK
jgi:SagB-type dehydrogenase family enzyme